MTTAGYNKCADWFYAHPGWLRMLRGGCRLLPLLLYAGYPVLLLVLALSRDIRFWKVLWIPAAVFVLVTVLRPIAGVHFPRDVLAAAVISLALGIPAFVWLPF